MKIGLQRALIAIACSAALAMPFTALAKPNNTKAAKAEAKAEAARRKNEADLARASDTFGPFCEAWMGKLAIRESENLSKREWKATGNGYHGTYVGYSKEHGCTVSNDGTVPVGRVLYREVTYSQEGSTLDEAKGAVPQPVEIYEVTELFQFSKGKWSTD